VSPVSIVAIRVGSTLHKAQWGFDGNPIRSLIERMNREIGQRIRVIRQFPMGDQCAIKRTRAMMFESPGDQLKYWKLRVSDVRVIAGLFLAGFFIYGIGVYAFTQLLVPITAEFAWGRTAMGGMMSAFWLAAPVVFIAVFAFNRVGICVLLVAGAIAEASGLLLMTLVSHPTEFYLLRILMGVGKVLVVTPVSIVTAVWFPRRTGAIFAIVLSGWHFGGLILAPVTTQLIALNGWRATALELSVLLVLGMWLAIGLVGTPRERQETVQEPGAEDPSNSQHRKRDRLIADVGLPTLLAIAWGTLTFYAGYAGLLSHFSSMLVDVGYQEQAVGLAMGTVALTAACGVLAGGAFTQWLPSRITGFILLSLMGVLCAGALSLTFSIGMPQLISVTLLLGLLIGAGDPILYDALRQAVPRPWFADVWAWWYLLCLSALTGAPVLVGAVYDRYFSYRIALALLGASTGTAAITWLFAFRSPVRLYLAADMGCHESRRSGRH
jgi:MFS family permease